MNFYKGDIVEFMNTDDRHNLGKFLNMKFRLTESFKAVAEYGELVVFELPGSGRRDICVHERQVFLYKRPMKNWFKKLLF